MVTIRRASLAVHGGPMDRMNVLLAGMPIHLGRRQDNDMVINEATVSRRHAVVENTPFGFAIHDLGSPNGTYVNGGRVGHEGHLLRHGDKIRLAGSRVTLTFLQEALGTIIIEGQSPPSRSQIWPATASA